MASINADQSLRDLYLALIGINRDRFMVLGWLHFQRLTSTVVNNHLEIHSKHPEILERGDQARLKPLEECTLVDKQCRKGASLKSLIVSNKYRMIKILISLLESTNLLDIRKNCKLKKMESLAYSKKTGSM